MKSVRLPVVLCLLANPVFSQTAKPVADVQQQILDELRAIHRDIRATSTLQLLLAELQMTQTTLERSIQRRDGLRAQLVQVQAEKPALEANVKRFQEGAERVPKPDQEFIDRYQQLKLELQNVITLESSASSQLQDAEGRLRSAQADHENVQGQLGDLVKKLGAVN